MTHKDKFQVYNECEQLAQNITESPGYKCREVIMKTSPIKHSELRL